MPERICDETIQVVTTVVRSSNNTQLHESYHKQTKILVWVLLLTNKFSDHSVLA